jgi:heterodisulfide reductase subunit C
MYLTQIPFFPTNRPGYELEDLRAVPGTVAELYPEMFKCVGCNTCTRGCPMDLDVMEYMSRAIRGDIAAAAELSFACVMCGICAARCPGETQPYLVGILCRRLYGKYLAPKAKHLAEQVGDIDGDKFEEGMRDVMKKSEDELRELYRSRQMEPATGPEDWTPDDKTFI